MKWLARRMCGLGHDQGGRFSLSESRLLLLGLKFRSGTVRTWHHGYLVLVDEKKSWNTSRILVVSVPIVMGLGGVTVGVIAWKREINIRDRQSPDRMFRLS